MAEAINPQSMKVFELKAALSKRNLDSSGLKQDLVQRLQVAFKIFPSVVHSSTQMQSRPATAWAR